MIANLRTIFSATAAATLLVVGPGWALAGPSGRIGGDVTGNGSGVVSAAEDGVNGEAVAESTARFDAEFDAGDAPEAPEAPQMPEAPQGPEVSAPETPQAPEAPQGSGAGAPELPQAPEVPQPETPQAPDAPATPETPSNKGDKPALDKGDGGVRAEGEVHLSGSVRGGNPPEADGDADGRGAAEAMGQRVQTP